MLSLAIIALPGWLIVAGAALTSWLNDRTSWSSVPFGVGALAALLMFRLGDVVMDDDARPQEKGRIPWFSEAASEIRLSRAHLTRRAEAAGLPQRAVIAVVWAPWWAMIAFWVFLVLNTVFQFVSDGG